MQTSITLTDKYQNHAGLVYMTGIQALVRLPLDQQRLDQQAGLNTAGFISGYRGSPLAGYDIELGKAAELLNQHHIVFQPGVNEDLAATAVWGSQQVTLFPEAMYEGVFGLWYGKAPGVDRSGDVFRHANFAGSSAKGGVLLIAGDDHECKSSTLPSQSEYAFVDAEIPVLNPAGIQDVLDLGLAGIAMSRFSGCFVALIALADVMDAGAVVNIDLQRQRLLLPEDFLLPADGLHIRLDDNPHAQEQRHRQYKLQAAQAFATVNQLNRVLYPGNKFHTILVASGKAYLDLLQALEDLGINPRQAAEQGIGIVKIGMSWPLDKTWLQNTLADSKQVLVIEEKRPLIEQQIKTALYDLSERRRPQVLGKQDQQGRSLLADTGALHSAQIAETLGKLFPEHFNSYKSRQYLAKLRYQRGQTKISSSNKRMPFYCSGCPHNRSTKVPEGSRAMVGIGCHYIAQWMDRDTKLVTHMGGEGVPWVGQAPFTKEKHIFINLGDGTYFHSGILAIRQAVAANVNVTYKLLFNDAVAMTGGQSHDGPLSVPTLVQQLQAEGVARIEVVSEQPERYPALKVWHRDEFDRIQQELREQTGASVIIYDQTCATKKRKLRKKGQLETPDQHIFINDLVCEGCGDCSKQSNCISVQPLNTEFGVKREINQYSCNKDTTCVEGFCPSFATVRGAKLNTKTSIQMLEELPSPPLPVFQQASADILITGIGGTGVTTLSAILGMAAHIEQKSVAVLDQSGLAQKGGAVVSHLRIAQANTKLHSGRLSEAAATLLLGCDLVTAATPETRFYLNPENTVAVINEAMLPTGDFVLGHDINNTPGQLLHAVQNSCNKSYQFNAIELAEQLLGDQLFANVIVLGYAYQLGLVPIEEQALQQAFELNGQAVSKNLLAFKVGRLACVKAADLQVLLTNKPFPDHQLSDNLDAVIQRRLEFLTQYQNQAYADVYLGVVETARRADKDLFGKAGELTSAVARNLFKLMAYKDEYEVARLYSEPEYQQKLKRQFAGNFKVSLHLAPPLFARRDVVTGQPKKREYGPWVFPLLRGLAKFKFLRDTRFDPFGYTEERRAERAEIVAYQDVLAELLETLNHGNYAQAIEICNLPDQVRGFGHVKQATLQAMRMKRQGLLVAFHQVEVKPLLAVNYKIAA